MRDSVRAAFVAFNGPLEGILPYMYLDVKGLVTCSMGVLVDPVAGAIRLPWRLPSGGRADSHQIQTAWLAVKARQDIKMRGGGAFAGLTDLRLDDDGIHASVDDVLTYDDRCMWEEFGDWPTWPSDAQMFALSMCWAIGAGWPANFPHCAIACQARDWLVAAHESHISDVSNPGIKPRNKENLILLGNAGSVDRMGLDPNVLYWPGTPSINI